MTIVRASGGTPLSSSRRGSRRGGAKTTTKACTRSVASWLAGMQTRSAAAIRQPTPVRVAAAPTDTSSVIAASDPR